jgi:hypothetical protein
LAVTRTWLAAAFLLAVSGGAGWSQDTVEEIMPPTLSDLPDTFVLPWLSDTVTRPHANVATSATRPDFEILPIDAVELDAVGLLPRSITGLPATLWGTSDAEDLARLFRAQPVTGLPAALSLTEMLALAELAPPANGGTQDGELFLARVDMLLARGALDPALALMERAGATDPQVFRRFFDVSLLIGHGDRACRAMDANPDIAPTFPARIFCLARGGDWAAAALSFGTGEALGRFDPLEADLIARFLDPQLFEGEGPLPRDPALTPLAFEMRMAIAERPDLTGEPLALVHADLSPLAGWRGQLAAVERLTRSGAVEPQQWFAIYTSRVPAASGGVWDRVAAIQALDAALLAGNAADVAARLPEAFDHMREAGLTVAFATIFAERLQRVPLTGEAGLLARRIGLLSPMYERIAQSAIAQNDLERMVFAVAQGQSVEAPVPGDDAISVAVAGAFSGTPAPHGYGWLLDNDRMGEAFLRAALVLSDREADPGDIGAALVLLREVGFEDVARRSALQLLLDRPLP